MRKHITSTSNPVIKDLVKLAKRSKRNTDDRFIIEGYRPVVRALETGFKLQELYFCPEWFLGKNEFSVVETAEKSGAVITQLSKAAFAKIAYRDRPEGIIGVGKQWHTSLKDLNLSKTPFIIIVESIEKPGNLGTILRSADATGAEAVIVCDPVTDIFNPNVVRSSTGVLFRMQIAVANVNDVLRFCAERSIKTLAATPHTSHNYTQADMKQPLAIVMGSEQFGLSDRLMDACDIQVAIPMLGLADSLNVSAATVVLAYEVVRQRNSKE